jgi:hypothetical protein
LVPVSYTDSAFEPSSAEIAEALTCEFGTNVDAAWVERLVALLEGLKLVARH